ncbi:MAG: ATP-binding protein [Porticoccaceae bacterium]|nr:ATP-binding protein [Porticoccaceae bacterium]
MSILKNVQTGRVVRAPKGIIYGPPGCGKSTFALRAQDAHLVNTENGALEYGSKSPYLETWPQIKQWLDALENDPHDYRVIAIDTLDWLLRRVEEHVAGVTDERGALDRTLTKAHGGYGSGKLIMNNYVYRMLLPIFDRFVNRGWAVILLAHAKRTEMTDVEGVTTVRTAPDIADERLNVFIEWSDFVGLAQVLPTGERVMSVTDQPHAVGKNRYGLPPQIPFTWDAFASEVRRANQRAEAARRKINKPQKKQGE